MNDTFQYSHRVTEHVIMLFSAKFYLARRIVPSLFRLLR